jgi:segregation and condensation protein B
MSLKAKLEAVIYASEEPVALAQLVGLLSDEAQAELDALDARQTELALDDSNAAAGEAAGDADALNAEVLDGDAALEREAPAAATADDDQAADDKTADSDIADSDKADSDIAGADKADSDKADADIADADKAAKAAERDAKAQEQQRARVLRDYFRQLIDDLMRDFAQDDRGIELREIAGGFRFATKPEYHDAVRGFVKSLKPPLKLTLQALETLAVIAYKQPVTAPEISEIRGVDSSGVLGSLMTRKLIQTAGRKQVIGRPMLYKTTKDFLVRFGLKDIQELPSIEEFEKMAGELIHDEPVQEEIPLPDAEAVQEATPQEVTPQEGATLQEAAAAEPEANVHEPQADGTP